MTEVLLLLVALLLSLARVPRTVRRLILQLSGAQLGTGVTSLVIGMLAEPSLAAAAAAAAGAWEPGGLGGAASTVATVPPRGRRLRASGPG